MSYPVRAEGLVDLIKNRSKYKDLEIEIEKIWHLKTTTAPVIVGALGMIKKGTDKHTNKIPGCVSLYEIGKFEIYGPTHFLR